MTDRYDLLLAGGTVIHPATGRQELADVAIEGGAVVDVGPNLVGAAKWRLDCRGAHVMPGWIDLHTHIFQHATTLGVAVEEACWQRGVTFAVDAGSAGAWTLPALQ